MTGERPREPAGGETGAPSPEALRRALGQFPTGVAIVTATRDGKPFGMTVNSFAAVSLEPPLILWSVARSAFSHDAFAAADAFAVHFLGSGHHELALRFAGRALDKFAGVSHRAGQTGAPLIEELAPSFECRSWARYPGGDHSIIVGEVVRLFERSHDPLLFHSGVLRGIEGTRQPAKLADDSFARNYLAYLLARASSLVSGAFHGALPQWNLTVPEWRVLACLSDVEALSVGELAAMALMKQPRLTRVLDGMEEAGLIERHGSREDRRRVTIHLTPTGRERVAPVLVAAKAHEEAFLKPFTRGERLAIKQALDLLIDRNGRD
jgi:flavin reductase (DIM6/NTAB) family NADH-FMN oxidoreductase RutF/DNA-binding MarR family transcriptional regulator